VGQPAAPAPRKAIEAAQAALAQGRIDYTSALGIPRCAPHRAHVSRRLWLRGRSERIVVTTDRRARSFSAFWRCSSPVTASRDGYPAIRRIGIS